MACMDCGKGHADHGVIEWRDEQGRRCRKFVCPGKKASDSNAHESTHTQDENGLWWCDFCGSAQIPHECPNRHGKCHYCGLPALVPAGSCQRCTNCGSTTGCS